MLLAEFANGRINVKRLDLTGGAAIAEVVGTIGIIVSLVFVAHSVSSNTNEVRASQINVIYNEVRHIEMTIASDPEWAEIVLRGRSRVEQLSELDQFRYDAFVVAMLDLWDQLISRDLEGLMPEGEMEDWDAYFEAWVERYVSDSDWQRFKWQYSGPLLTRMETALTRKRLR